MSSFVRGQLGKLDEIHICACVDAFTGLFNGPRIIPPNSFVVVYHGKVSIVTGGDKEDGSTFHSCVYRWQGKERVVDSFEMGSVS